MSRENRNLRFASNYLMAFILFCVGLLISSCNEQARGFALPAGNIEEGKATYKRLACNECHSTSEIAWKGGRDSLEIHLGGEVAAQKSYGELVTSIINPSHKIAAGYDRNTVTEGGFSKMKNYNEVMTIRELVDLVTFLQTEYDVSIPKTYYYPYY